MAKLEIGLIGGVDPATIAITEGWCDFQGRISVVTAKAWNGAEHLYPDSSPLSQLFFERRYPEGKQVGRELITAKQYDGGLSDLGVSIEELYGEIQKEYLRDKAASSRYDTKDGKPTPNILGPAAYLNDRKDLVIREDDAMFWHFPESRTKRLSAQEREAFAEAEFRLNDALVVQEWFAKGDHVYGFRRDLSERLTAKWRKSKVVVSENMARLVEPV